MGQDAGWVTQRLLKLLRIKAGVGIEGKEVNQKLKLKYLPGPHTCMKQPREPAPQPAPAECCQAGMWTQYCQSL